MSAKKKVVKKAVKTVKKVEKIREPSERQRRLLAAFGGIGKVKTLQELGDTAYARERPAAKRHSWARNNVRWLLGQKMVRKVKPGKYERRA